MYFHLAESDNTGFDLVLSAQDEDEDKEKWPAKRAYFEDKVKDE